MQYYIVICTWYTDKYDKGTIEVKKVFTEKDAAYTYCNNKNKEINKNIKQIFSVVEESRDND